MTHGSLFSGIGGFDLASEWMGWDNVFHCEINPFCRKILEHYWKDSISYEDITKTDFTPHRGRISVLTGGFPCQPFSNAGKRLGSEDDRYLWKEMLRAIQEIQPSWIVGENVHGLVNWNEGMVFKEVLSDLEDEGYSVQSYILPACSVNAPHRRDRIWIVGKKEWTKVVFADECKYENWDTFRECPMCPQCRQDYTECPCPGPTMEGFEYTEINGRLFARKTPSHSQYHGHSSSQRGGGNGEIGSRSPQGEDCPQQLERMGEPGELEGLQGDDTKPHGKGYKRDKLHGTSDPKKEKRREFSSRSTSKFYQAESWTDFPTQPPICSRDDGISTELDGITFPKWRNESIKAYGNAVVPQVVYQIFKSIEAYEKA